MSLAELRAQLAETAAGFSPDKLTAEACQQVVADVVAMEKLLGTIKGLAAAKVADTDLWRGRGDASPAHDLARRSGTSVREAKDAIEAGKRLGSIPALEAAARLGELSPAQTAAIADAVTETGDEGLGERLVEKAKRCSLGELREECLRAKAASRSGEENHRRIKAKRRLRTWTDGEGGWNLAMRDTPEAGAEIIAVLDRLRDRIFRTAHREGRSEPSEAYAADAMVEMARRAADGEHADGDFDERAATANDAAPQPAPPVRGTKIIVRIDWDALVRGWPIDGEVCEIAGLGPVPVSLVRTMIESGDPFLAAVATKGTDVHTVAHLGRRANAAQQTGLDWLQPTCVAEACNDLAHLQIDHRHDWADTRITLLPWLDRLCHHHHDLKTRDNWQLVPGTGKRPMVPPDDPRHPRHADQRDRDGPTTAAA